MYSFEGDFRRKPQQNLAGASAQRNSDRNALIAQTQQQRQKREMLWLPLIGITVVICMFVKLLGAMHGLSRNCLTCLETRKRLYSTIKIQAYARSYLVRKQCKQEQRESFDSLFPRAETSEHESLSCLVAKLLFFYNETQDFSRLISISQLLLKRWKKIFQCNGATIQIRRLLLLHLKMLRNMTDVPVAVPLRMFEVFTSVASAEQSMGPQNACNSIALTFSFLVRRGYFEDLRNMLCLRTPPLYGPSASPPTPLCAAILDLIQRPLDLTNQTTLPDYDDTVLTSFASCYLCSVYPEPIEMFILPALAQDTRRRFPFKSLLACLNEDKFRNSLLVNDSWLLHAVLVLEPSDFVQDISTLNHARLPNNPLILEYLKIIAKLTINLCNKQISYEYEDSLYSIETAVDRDEDSDGSDHEPNPTSLREQLLLTRCLELLNEPDRCLMKTCQQISSEYEPCEEFIDYMSKICHNLLLSHRMALHKYRLLYTLAFKPIFLRSLWRWLSSMSHPSSFGGSSTPLLSALSRGMSADSTTYGLHRLLAPLAVFCALFSLLIGTLHDTEFCRNTEDEEKIDYDVTSTSSSAGGGRIHAFEFSELGGLCRTLRQVCLGLVELAYPESRPTIGQYRDAVGSHTIQIQGNKETPAWSHLFKVCTALVRVLYVRDGRLHFCPDDSPDGGGWTCGGAVPEGSAAVLLVAGTHARPNPRQLMRPSNPLHHKQEDGPPLTIKELRTVTILREIPFVVPFSTRIQIFQGLLAREKHDYWYEMTNFNEGPIISITVRRSHLYEDAFDKLSPDNEPNMKLKLRVHLINQAGAEEAGVDGGGLFREFLSELLKSAFDPNRGLFRLNKDNMLYPNPGVHLLYENFPMHYFFIGRMLGKALYENLLVELPLAEFFLSKLCSTREGDVHALASLDPALYRGLLMLKTIRKEDVPDLGLDFTVLTDELGEQRIEELKPGGANIAVTAENRIEYIHLVADYKLNRQIRAQCNAFKRGLTSVVKGEWLRMFSCRELQLLISGAEVPIDLEDLKKYTHYAGGFSETHPTIQCYWKVVENFTDVQRRQLLKFVTSCSRPPLLGFKDLQPPFCIQSSGAIERLPSSSTCMNLLKLPEFNNEEILQEKLLYAIQSGAGFELS